MYRLRGVTLDAMTLGDVSPSTVGRGAITPEEHAEFMKSVGLKSTCSRSDTEIREKWKATESTMS
jgi:hypothetical protein